MSAQRLHQPVVTDVVGAWAVHCDECSRMEGDYVYPCGVAGVRFPPRLLVQPDPDA